MDFAFQPEASIGLGLLVWRDTPLFHRYKYIT